MDEGPVAAAVGSDAQVRDQDFVGAGTTKLGRGQPGIELPDEDQRQNLDQVEAGDEPLQLGPALLRLQGRLGGGELAAHGPGGLIVAEAALQPAPGDALPVRLAVEGRHGHVALHRPVEADAHDRRGVGQLRELGEKPALLAIPSPHLGPAFDQSQGRFEAVTAEEGRERAVT